MILTRTPFRISFFGGGTDYPVWYERHGGAVLSTAIDKYCYVTCRYLPPFFEGVHTRVVWSKVELVKKHEEIEHPAVKGALQFFNIQEGLEIHHTADLPARSGLGAGSSFVVGLVNAIKTLQGKETTKHDLAKTATHIERNVMHEHVGSQDQVAAAFGGFNKIVFKPSGEVEVLPANISADVLAGLRGRLLLFFTGLSRSASEIAQAQIKNTPNKEADLAAMHGMVDQGLGFLRKGNLDEFGKLLHASWQLKRGLSDLISSNNIDAMYAAARGAGALGGKLLGAGGGGFLLVYADPAVHEKVKAALGNLLCVPFDFDVEGSKVVYRDHAGGEVRYA